MPIPDYEKHQNSYVCPECNRSYYRPLGSTMKICWQCDPSIKKPITVEEIEKIEDKKLAKRMIEKARRLRNCYGITLEQYNDKVKAQGGKCEICKSPEPGIKDSFHVDHCHTTGKVRGLLCGNCNMMLGFGLDNPMSMRSGADYVEKYSKEHAKTPPLEKQSPRMDKPHKGCKFILP